MKKARYRSHNHFRHKRDSSLSTTQVDNVDNVASNIKEAADNAEQEINQAISDRDVENLKVMPTYMFNRFVRANQAALSAAMHLQDVAEQIERWVSDQQ